MRQLPLDVRLADHAVFNSFYAGPNAAAVNAVKLASAGEGSGVLWLWGPAGSGKSHLLQACVCAADGPLRKTAYLPLAAEHGLEPNMLEGMGNLDLLCVDAADAVAGQAEWEHQLFRVFEELMQGGGRLVVAAADPVAAISFALPDLASRFASGETYRLRELNDADRLAALQLRAKCRGLDLPTETVQYLLNRVDRSTPALFGLLDQLDHAALAAQKRLTVPFVKSILGTH